MKEESRLVFISGDQKRIKEYQISSKKVIFYVSIFLIAVFVGGKFGLDMLVDISFNSKIKKLERTNAVLQARLLDMKERIKRIDQEMNLIAQQDDQLRTVLGLSELSADVREVGIGGSDYKYDFTDQVSGFEQSSDLSEQLTELAKLEREIKLELESYKDLLHTFQTKKDSLDYLPALRPILKGVISSTFGNRLHPVLKVYRHHEGLDFSAKTGTPIYATADGVVRYTGVMGGYGRMVIIDHKFGFETRYGHLNKYVVRKGQRVKRGEKIGEVGNSGLSTAPHLHYEVRFKGKPVNPKYYYFEDRILNERLVSKTNK
ncbi:MAG TPA: M23 family peptidase [Caldithrix abyssi]|uniref:M23 family peptidase n=1 Tax=Caldithrix abyssi TaxID=187145 RepID=A0A7V4TXS3_CALAY|nr:M23 family peptidase [Caldithrix abyssi]